MSTKSTLRVGPHHHLYRECFDEEAVYLEISHCEFSAEPGCVTVRIPVAVWEHIRDASPAQFDLASLSPSELRAHVRALWERRQKRVSSSKNPGFARMLEAAVWSGKTPAAELARGLRWHRNEQHRQRQLLREIGRLRKYLWRSATKGRVAILREPRNAPESLEPTVIPRTRAPEARPQKYLASARYRQNALRSMSPDIFDRSGAIQIAKLAKVFGTTPIAVERWLRLACHLPRGPGLNRNEALAMLAHITCWRSVTGRAAAFHDWLQTAEPLLAGKSPLAWIQSGHLRSVSEYVWDAMVGQPT